MTTRGRSGRRATTAVVFAVLAACGPDGSDAPAVDAPIAEAPIDRAAAIAAAVDVRAGGCGPRVGLGTGSVVAPGVVVTAAHVVAGASSIEIIDANGVVGTGEIVLFDPDLDLAVVRTAVPVGTPLPIRPTPAAQGEAGIVVLPRRIDDGMAVEVVDVTVVRRADVRTTDIYLDRRVERAGFEIEGSIDPGNSGATVVLPGGGAGVVWARSSVTDRRAWAIDLPPGVLDGSVTDLTAAVDVGPCIR